MAMTDFKIIRRSLFSRLFSTIITTITVATAVGLMLVLLTMPDAAESAFKSGSGNMHMLVSRDPSSMQSVLNGVFYMEAPGNSIDWKTYENLQKRIRILDYAIPIQQGDTYRGFPVLASTPEFFSRFKPAHDRDWEFTDGQPFAGEFEIVAGANVASALGLALGQELILTHGSGVSRKGTPDPEAKDDDEHAGSDHDHDDFSYTVVGILQRTGGPHDRAIFTDLNSAWIIHAHDRRERESSGHIEKTTIDDLSDDDRLITGVYLRVATRKGSAMSGAQQMVFNQLRADTSITVADPVQEINKMFVIIGNIDQIFIAMAIVVMISSGIAIMLALYNSMELRRRQIAVLRVLGCSQSRIFGLIVTESAILGVAGAVMGVALAWLGTEAVATVMNQKLGLVIDATLPLPITAIVIMSTIGLASVAGLVPAFQAYRTPVVRNLRPLG
ncbi:MAG: ABC transporter permease [Planctomycetota bacterium]|nr:ABC transporter permease [Planctomycetota bacterium]